MTAITFEISGRVQGVGFRWAAQEEATRLGVGGWIKNDSGGVVTGFAQGEADAVQTFQKWLKKGPKGAAVKKVEAERAEPAGYRLFTIRP